MPRACAAPRDRQPVAEHELLDLPHVLDVALPVQPRLSGDFPCTRFGKLLLPGTQHVRLHLQQLADVPGFVQLGVTRASITGFKWFRRFRGFREF